ncbi:MAG: glycoside hydrolase family 92 protein, partial [Acidobacteriota bacterium]
MKRVNILTIIFVIFFYGYSSGEKTVKDLAGYVNPFIGTKNMGHTFPGATTPFGMVQLSPETNIQPFFKNGKYNKDTYRYCSGYQYEDVSIFG